VAIICDAGGGTTVSIDFVLDYMFSLGGPLTPSTARMSLLSRLCVWRKKFPYLSNKVGLWVNPENPFVSGEYVLMAAYILGIPIGSTNIDEWFDKYIKTLLRDLAHTVGRPSSEERFQDIKASLGMGIADGVRTFEIPIPGLHKDISDQEIGVSEGCVSVKR
jgi:hypothetical protein